MGYHAKVLAHSSHSFIPDLLTVEVRFPRKVLAEVVTHRTCRDVFGEFEMITSDRSTTEDMSKNSASSRAIPIEKMIQAVMDDPFIPEKFSRAGKGMQGAGWLEGEEHENAKRQWLMARDMAVFHARGLLSLGVHKQDANRLLEPWAWVTQVVTADEIGWNNFFALRCHKDADPAFQKIARMIYLAKKASTSIQLKKGEWHLPFATEQRSECVLSVQTGGRVEPMSIPAPLRASAARCAWVSYENHDRESTQEAADRTFVRLCGASPVHASPLEHQATPLGVHVPRPWVSNLRGWLQLRKLIAGERTDKYDPSDEEIASWGMT